jgi:two-component system, LytTR family, sensor kinase
MNPRSQPGIRWRWIACYVGGWTLVAVVAAAQTYVSKITVNHPVPVRLAFFASVVEWYLWAFLTLGAVALGERFPFQPGKVGRRFLLHGAASAVTMLAYSTALALLLQGRWSLEGKLLTFAYVFRMGVLDYFPFNIMMYWLVLLGQQGWHHYGQSQQRELQAAALATELVRARLDALRMQINPHFLFNTLNTISALVHEKPEAAERMIARLSELLRRTLDHSDAQQVPLREEISFLQGYLEIEQMRFPDRLTVAFDIEPQTRELLVPHLILQPLVENALRHGILPREDPGRVDISARIVANHTLELKVRDNGNGLPAHPTATERPGIGLKNVRSRLAHLHGTAQSLDVKNAPGGGVEACLRLPCCTPAGSLPSSVTVAPTDDVGGLPSAAPPEVMSAGPLGS